MGRLSKERRHEIAQHAARVRWAKNDPKRPQTVEEFIAAGGSIVRCPTAAVGPTTGEVPLSDRLAHAARAAAVEQARAAVYAKTNWLAPGGKMT